MADSRSPAQFFYATDPRRNTGRRARAGNRRAETAARPDGLQTPAARHETAAAPGWAEPIPSSPYTTPWGDPHGLAAHEQPALRRAEWHRANPGLRPAR